MPDPFQNVSAAGPEFIEVFARQLEVRAAEPAMVAIVEAYLDGPEVSLFALSDGRTVVPLLPAQEFKRVAEGIQAFDGIYEKLIASTNASQKEKLEVGSFGDVVLPGVRVLTAARTP